MEAAWWRGRAARLASVMEQLRSRPCRAVLALAAAARCKPLKRWRELEAKARTAHSTCYHCFAVHWFGSTPAGNKEWKAFQLLLLSQMPSS